MQWTRFEPDPDFLLDDLPTPKPATPADRQVAVSADDLFDSFLDGLGINRVELHPSINRPEMMLTAGHVLREFVKGTTDLLASRANLKNTFRLDQTTVLPRQNNPMKFSENTNDLLKQLLIGDEGEYLAAEDAVREVCRDLINHQNAFIDAMNSAFIEFADRFDPAELQEGFDRTMGKNLFGFMSKMKYWQLYSDLYPIMTEKGGGRFPQMFGEEFVRAYERQVAEYQRHDRDGTLPSGSHNSAEDHAIDPGLMATQKLDPATMQQDIPAFKEHGVIEKITESGAMEIDQSFIDELDQTMNDDVPQDQLKG